MWVCPRCGEPHQDQFKECWKCVGAETSEHVTAEPPRPTLPAREPRLRSLSSVLARGVVGFGVGMLLGIAVFQRYGQPLAQAAVSGAVVGLVIAVIVTIFVWVVFPYEPMTRADIQESSAEQSDHLS